MTKRETYKIDAAGIPLGRLASQVATLLRGKQKPTFAYHLKDNDLVEIFNAAKIKLSGKKFQQKKYYHHSHYPGGLKTTFLKKIFVENPAQVLKKAVWNMLPKNKTRKEVIKRLKISN